MGKFEDLTASLQNKEQEELEAKNQLAEKVRSEKRAELARVNDFFITHVVPAFNDIKADLLSKDYAFEQLNMVGTLFSKEYKITLAKIPIEISLQHVRTELMFSLHSTNAFYKVKKTFSIDMTTDIVDEISYREHLKGLISDAVEAIVVNAAGS